MRLSTATRRIANQHSDLSWGDLTGRAKRIIRREHNRAVRKCARAIIAEALDEIE